MSEYDIAYLALISLIFILGALGSAGLCLIRVTRYLARSEYLLKSIATSNEQIRDQLSDVQERVAEHAVKLAVLGNHARRR